MSSKPAWMAALEKKKKKKLKKTSTRSGGSALLQQQHLKAGITGKRNLKKTKKSRDRSGLSDSAAQQYSAKQGGKSFTELLDAKSLEYFNEVCSRTFSEQAQFFLNAFWDEFGSQAEVIYAVHWDTIKKIDMESQGIAYLHLYEEGVDLDFDMSLVLFEKLHQRFHEGDKKAEGKTYPDAVPQMMTSIKRKKELRSKVDVNFDGRVGMIEYLLYQFKASPKTLMERSTRSNDIDPRLQAAKDALAEVNRRIKAYEKERARLTKIANKGKGVKALGAKNQLAQLDSSPLMEELRAALIDAEAKVRIVSKAIRRGGGTVSSGGGGEEGGGQPRTDGTVWWMQREIKEKKRLYGRKKRR